MLRLTVCALLLCFVVCHYRLVSATGLAAYVCFISAILNTFLKFLSDDIRAITNT